MASRDNKPVKNGSKYKLVYLFLNKGKEVWTASIGTKYGRNMKYFKTEREAALAVDKYLIEMGKNPVNILVRRK